MFSSIRIFFFAICVAATGSSALATVPQNLAATSPTIHGVTTTRYGAPDPMLAFGAAVVTAMVFCRTQQYLVPWFAVGTCAFGLMAAGYGCAIGAWPLGLAVGGYAVACLYKWIASRRRPVKQPPPRVRPQMKLQPWEESRMSRMFGPMA